MPDVGIEHFQRAAQDIGTRGDNDTLPFDIDNRFIKEAADALSNLAYAFFKAQETKDQKEVAATINELQVFSERLLVPTGSSGFRITTKIHPFWTVYLNGLGIAIAEKHEPERSAQAHSYRYSADGPDLFDGSRSWRAYREATLNDPALKHSSAFVIQADISSFYEHIYHHRLKSRLEDLLSQQSSVPTQIDRFLIKLASGRSFGLPVGGQCARVLAEVMMTPIDSMLSDHGIIWHRYVDDFTLITTSPQDAYRALSVLSYSLADYGLTLNRSKTTIMQATHYIDFVTAQLGATDEPTSILREIALHFDPYSDHAYDDYESLRETVEQLDIQSMLQTETAKTQPDSFIIAQIGRTLRFHSPDKAVKLCALLLGPGNLNAFRASWSTIMRGITSVRADQQFETIFDDLDRLLDNVPRHSLHLLLPEANVLHYLKAIRFRRTESRGRFVSCTYDTTRSTTVRRGCIECWHF
jgi:hypothetical protein